MSSESTRPAHGRMALTVGIGVAFLAAYPLWGTVYGMSIVQDALILGIFALSLDLLWGKGGLPSFGHAAFFGLGGYAYAIVSMQLGNEWGPLAGLVAALAICALAGAILGVFLLTAGIRGALFLIVTVAIVQIFHQVAISWSSLTGGDNGIVGLPPLGLRSLSEHAVLDTPAKRYFAVLLIAAAALLLLDRLCRGRFGRRLAAVVDNEPRALTLGINPSLELTKTLVLSTTIAGFAGTLFVASAGVVVPEFIGPLFSIEVVVWVLIGGRGTLIGPFVGTFVVWRLSQEVSSYDPRLWQLAIGSFFVLSVFLLPRGIASLRGDAARALFSRVARAVRP